MGERGIICVHGWVHIIQALDRVQGAGSTSCSSGSSGRRRDDNADVVVAARGVRRVGG